MATRMSQLLYNKKACQEIDSAGAVALCWDGTSVGGNNAHIGVARNTHTARGPFMKPKVVFYLKSFAHPAGTSGKHKDITLGIVLVEDASG